MKRAYTKTWPQKEFLLIKNYDGKVIIIDARSYEEIINFTLAELKKTVVVTIRDVFYNIDTINGKITITDVENIVNGQSDISWIHAGSFPGDEPEPTGTTNSAVVSANQQYIYFVAHHGALFVYDTTVRTVKKLGTLDAVGYYASMIIVNSVLYISKSNNFYSFDGSSIEKISTPEKRGQAGLFQMGNNICRLGGNNTDVYPDPVACYNPADKEWTANTSYINEARWHPGIVTTQLGTCIFGGSNHYGDVNFEHYRDSAEIFDHQTETWSYIPSPLVDEIKFIQVITFHF